MNHQRVIVGAAAAVLCLTPVGLAGGAAAAADYATHRADLAVKATERGWCGLLGLIVSVPVSRPTGAAADPQSPSERGWLIYRAALARRRALGCSP